MVINENTTWEEVGSTSTGGNGRVRDAFKNGTAKKVLLVPTFKLYKFNEYRTLAAPDSKSVGPWWSPYEAYEWDAGWVERKNWPRIFMSTFVNWGALLRPLRRIGTRSLMCW